MSLTGLIHLPSDLYPNIMQYLSMSERCRSVRVHRVLIPALHNPRSWATTILHFHDEDDIDGLDDIDEYLSFITRMEMSPYRSLQCEKIWNTYLPALEYADNLVFDLQDWQHYGWNVIKRMRKQARMWPNLRRLIIDTMYTSYCRGSIGLDFWLPRFIHLRELYVDCDTFKRSMSLTDFGLLYPKLVLLHTVVNPVYLLDDRKHPRRLLTLPWLNLTVRAPDNRENQDGRLWTELSQRVPILTSLTIVLNTSGAMHGTNIMHLTCFRYLQTLVIDNVSFTQSSTDVRFEHLRCLCLSTVDQVAYIPKLTQFLSMSVPVLRELCFSLCFFSEDGSLLTPVSDYERLVASLQQLTFLECLIVRHHSTDEDDAPRNSREFNLFLTVLGRVQLPTVRRLTMSLPGRSYVHLLSLSQVCPHLDVLYVILSDFTEHTDIRPSDVSVEANTTGILPSSVVLDFKSMSFSQASFAMYVLAGFYPVLAETARQRMREQSAFDFDDDTVRHCVATIIPGVSVDVNSYSPKRCFNCCPYCHDHSQVNRPPESEWRFPEVSVID
jgi:hypothetical protein